MDQEKTNACTQHTETSPSPQEMDRNEARTNFVQNDPPQTPSSFTNPTTTFNRILRERRTLVRREEQIESRELALAEREAAIREKEVRINKLLEEVEESTRNSNVQEEETRGFNHPQNQEGQQDGDNSLRSAKVSEIKPENFEDNSSDNTMKNNALGSFYAPWSETGSLYAEKKAKNNKYNVPAHDWPQTSYSNTGHPLIQMSLPPKLKILTGDAIEAFLHDFQNVVRSVPGISLRYLLTEEVSEATIKLMMMHKVDRNYAIVKGLADTGAYYNVSSVESIEPYILREEKPKFVKEIEFLDKNRYPIDKVVIAKVILIQKDFKLNLREQRFFCVRSPPWDDIIVGERTLRRFGVELDVSKAPDVEKAE
eukprot:augustus_masked-scaffold_16-processed-gene-1.6-mRNA-1 protein AED:1.00 eAED:1.00 QI:0/0/0/0/1/1/3/0/367